MKHLSIVAILLLAIAMQPAAAPTEQQVLGINEQTVAVNDGAGSQQLSAQEMSSAVGGENLTGCWGYTDIGGDKHEICCLDVWLFRICVDANVSAAERLLNQLI